MVAEPDTMLGKMTHKSWVLLKGMDARGGVEIGVKLNSFGKGSFRLGKEVGKVI